MQEVIPANEMSPESLSLEYISDSGQVRQNSVLPKLARMTGL